MKKLKIKTLTNVRAKGWEEGDNGAILKVEDANGDIKEVECDNILVTVGRRPNSEQLSNMGVELNERGYVKTDDQQRTNIDGVFAIGDITGRTMLAHGASYEGELAAEVIAGHNRHYQALTVPAVVFTDPEIGIAGLQEHEAVEQGYEVKVGQMPFAALGRAMTTGGSTDGFFKVVLDAADDRVLGVTIVGPNASDLISEAALAVELWAEGLDLGLTIHPHPTLGEGMMEAAKHALGEAIHIANKK
jgi:dihydrolipoamide dehydrogenase